MERFPIKNRISSLVLPVITLLFGVWTGAGGSYNSIILKWIVAGCAFTGAIVMGLLIMLMKIDLVPYLKSPVIAYVVTFWLHIVAAPMSINPLLGNFYNYFFLAVDITSVLIMMIKLPNEIKRRESLTIFFANPVLYYIIDDVLYVFSEFLAKLDLV